MIDQQRNHTVFSIPFQICKLIRKIFFRLFEQMVGSIGASQNQNSQEIKQGRTGFNYKITGY